MKSKAVTTAARRSMDPPSHLFTGPDEREHEPEADESQDEHCWKPDGQVHGHPRSNGAAIRGRNRKPLPRLDFVFYSSRESFIAAANRNRGPGGALAGCNMD